MSFDDLNLAVFGIWYIVFLFSTVAHEAAHGLAAQLGGDPTAYEGGQVTLDPNVPDEIGRVSVHGLRAFGTRWDVEAIGTRGHVRLAREGQP